MLRSIGYSASEAKGRLSPWSFERRSALPHDVTIQIEYCGLCHSDLHVVDNDWGFTKFPVVAGHEIVGRVTSIGSAVSKFKVGDLAAIGCYVDSCRQCVPCRSDKQHMCVEGMTGTFGGTERQSGLTTHGGFSSNYVADESYVLRIPANLDLAAAAPLLCAGITTYSPLRKWKVGTGQSVAIAGLGGLGHLAVKLAVARGAKVTVITTSRNKVADAEALGAADVVISTDPKQMARSTGRFDFLLDTIASQHDINAYLNCVRPEGTLCLVGLPPEDLAVSSVPLIMGQKCLSGSLIGGLEETQEMLDFCGEHDITAQIEILPVSQINDAYERLRRNDVKYRFVLSMAELA